MSDKFDDFMKRNVPEASGALRTLELPSRKNWIAGIALSGLVAASVVLTTINRPTEDSLTDDIVVSFTDEFPDEIQDAELIFDEI